MDFKCFNCGSKSFIIGPAAIPIGKTMVEDFPATECLKCGEKWLDSERIAELEKYLSSLDIVPAVMTNEQVLWLEKE
jgi:DNA-directed RNA polymerase subunit RPC12/RpoP